MMENKENFVISTPKACDAFQSQFYRYLSVLPGQVLYLVSCQL
jgi:hypothetical protein